MFYTLCSTGYPRNLVRLLVGMQWESLPRDGGALLTVPSFIQHEWAFCFSECMTEDSPRRMLHDGWGDRIQTPAAPAPGAPE